MTELSNLSANTRSATESMKNAAPRQTTSPSSSPGLLNQVGLGITTKDRWDDLAVTLTQLKKQGYGDVETIVIDDGSKHPAPASLRDAFPNIRFERVEHSLGLVVQRNRLAQMLSSTYYLSLDDDSFPLTGDIGKAASWLEDHPTVIALAFQIVRRNRILRDDEVLGEPFPIQYYIGCGHLLRRTQFLELGGYLERLHYYSEENQFCLDALLGGYSTYAYPAVAVRHNRTPAARNSAKATRYYVRNQAILGFLYFPFPYSILRALNCLSLLRDPEWNDHPGKLLLGWMEAFVCAFRWRKLRRPLPMAQFRAWKKLPVPRQ
jgi:GT2 family glycosyltransferase